MDFRLDDDEESFRQEPMSLRSTESALGQRLRDVIGLEIGDGTAQASKLVIARSLLGRAYAP